MTDALGHDYQTVVTAPTCDAMGYTTHTCTRCGNSYVDSYTQAADPQLHERGDKAADLHGGGRSYLHLHELRQELYRVHPDDRPQL